MRRVLAILLAALALVPASTALAVSKSGGFTIYIGADREFYSVLSVPAISPVSSEATWAFGDRVGYRCAYFYLRHRGQAVARVTVERYGASYTIINDRGGVEQRPQTACPSPAVSASEGQTAGGRADIERNGALLASLSFAAVDPANDESFWFMSGPGVFFLHYEEHGENELVARVVVEPLAADVVIGSGDPEPVEEEAPAECRKRRCR
jgi:hypothetical protein